MRVEGETARAHSAVRMDSMLPVEGKGVLLLADEATGQVEWRDTADERRTVTLGQHAIRIVRRPVLSSGG